MEKVRVFCRGKINLSLNILGRNEKLHYIDSVMQAINLGDYVTAAPRLDNRLNITFAGASEPIGENNSARRACDALRRRFGDFGADIIVEKNLPVGGGLGGGSGQHGEGGWDIGRG